MTQTNTPANDRLRVTVLGCGGSLGVPVIGNDWGCCNPDNPRNRRSRASIMMEGQGTRLLVDTPPDIRSQLLRENIDRFDALLFTHHHADHTNGLDDLRPVSWKNGKPIDVYAHPETLTDLEARFSYIFKALQNTDEKPLYRPFMSVHHLAATQQIGNLTVQAFEQDHHTCISMGFRVGGFAYSTDLVRLDDNAFRVLEGVDTWIVDCTRREPFPSHAHMDLTLEWIERVKPRRAFLTHMNFTMDYDAIDAETPDHVKPAYDGLSFDVSLSE
ncbi:MAG TPA: MBL fold metallo-hydrolase [Rhodospirillaceae bacterium]|nr:MBL fold metallo-hydrolase [Alphaproteobacteria bacterium]OUT42375.1 MAG: hypothetical protein CBB62_08855 [Micavibrio sp. TMED2]HCI46524.1 MBL fold metallo-hydrolase [Rhodospirillaceae bacterium]MAS45990.1 MBL fold metallo-hydrolase [Alphaproteobacteria bacterium]MAX95828.1 MBL fold metallo-hydrolase [Alphaproteobacteria bacterium]|tara:strand:- start:262 stop:1077 length:816 start_codon:yes stop_codon:yes gene_type:complete